MRMWQSKLWTLGTTFLFLVTSFLDEIKVFISRKVYLAKPTTRWKISFYSLEVFDAFLLLLISDLFLHLCRGTSGIDIDLRQVDIDQCRTDQVSALSPLYQPTFTVQLTDNAGFS